MSLLSRLSLFFAGLLAVLPFLQYRHYYPITNFYTEWWAFALGLFSLVFLLKKWSGFPFVALFPLLMILLIWLQFFMGKITYIEQAEIFTLYMLWGACLIVLISHLKKEFGTERLCRFFAFFLLAGAVLNALAAVIEHYSIQTVLGYFITPNSSPTVYGNLAQKNHFAEYLTLGFSSLLYLLAKKNIPPWVSFPLYLFLLFVIGLSGSRSAWFYLLALAFFSALFYARKKDAESSQLMLLAWASLPAFALLQWLPHLPFFPQGSGALTSSERLIQMAGESSIRLYLWKEALLMFQSAPFFGVGFGQFAWHHFVYGPIFKDPQISGFYNNAHNIFLHLLAETGIAGIAIVFGGLFLWTRRAFSWETESWWIFVLLIISLAHNFLEYPLWYAHFLGISMIVLGLGETRSYKIRFGWQAAAVVIFSGAVFLAATMKDYLRLEGLLYPGYYNSQPKLESAALYNALWDLRKRHSLLAPYVEFPLVSMIPLEAQGLVRNLEMHEKVSRMTPAGIVPYRYALLLAMAGKKEEAVLQIESAAYASPELIEEAMQLIASSPDKEKLTEINQKLKELKSEIHRR